MESWHPRDAVLIARKRDKMNQKVLADKAGLSQSQLSRIENGESDITWSQILMFSEIQGRDLEWYVFGPARSDAGTQRSLLFDGVNGSDVAVITKTDDEAAADTFISRRSFLGGAVKDLQPAAVLSFETPNLFEDDWLDLRLEKVG